MQTNLNKSIGLIFNKKLEEEKINDMKIKLTSSIGLMFKKSISEDSKSSKIPAFDKKQLLKLNEVPQPIIESSKF